MAMGSKSACVAATAFGALALATSASLAQEQTAAPQNQWFKVCTKQADNDICNVQNVRTAQTGQLLTAVNLIQITGKQNRALFQVAVPTGRVIPAGIGMQIDGGETQRIPYSICLPDRCIAEAPLTEQLVAAFKAGGSMTLTTVNFQNQPNPIEVTLSGFTAAFDGDPIRQSEVEERQQGQRRAVVPLAARHAERRQDRQRVLDLLLRVERVPVFRHGGDLLFERGIDVPLPRRAVSVRPPETLQRRTIRCR